MTQKSFDYLSAKKRGFEFVRAIEEPKTEIQRLMDEKRAEKAAQQVAAKQPAPEVKKAVGKPSKQPANEV